jgi:hypothetical protein
MGPIGQEIATRWSPSAIHDTVAAIVRQPMYATPLRQSLVGRFFRYLLERIADIIRLFRGSADARFLLIVAAILVVIVIGARIAVARQLGREGRGARSGVRTAYSMRRDPWIVARELAAAGDFTEACHSLYAAVLETLAREGAIKFHASKTSGDYARELRRRGWSALAEFRTFARELDRVIYGTIGATANDYERLSHAAEQAVRRAAAA